MRPVLNPMAPRARRLILVAALLLPAFFGLTADPATASNAIRVLVNGEPITTYDVEQRTRMLRVFTGGRQGEQAAIEQLIDEKLMLQEAERRRVSVSDEQVDAEFANRARSAKLSASQFAQAMRQAGFDPQTFKNFLRANMAWGQIVSSRFRATVDITDQDVARALTGRDTSTDEQQTATEYLLQQIIFVVSSSASAAQQRRQAEAFRRNFQGCDQSLQQASGIPGVVVKPPVRREEGQIGAEKRAELAALDVGSVTKPESVAEGIQIVAVCAKNKIAGETETEVEVRQEITSERGQLLARRYLRDLRSDAAIEYR
jgi:peptidyl-prolyl cis-trans isomerase SurA